MKKDSLKNQDQPRERRGEEDAAAADPEQIKTGLKLKFVGTIILLIFSMSLVFFLFYYQGIKSLVQEFDKRGAALTETFAAQVSPYLALRSLPEVERAAKYLMEIKDVVYVQALDGEARELLMKKQNHVSGIIPGLLLRESSGLKRAGRNLVLPGAGRVREFILPVWLPADGKRIGTIRVGLSSELIQQALTVRSIWVLGVFLLFLLLGIAAALYLSRIIVDPIQRLARAMKAVAIEEEVFNEFGLPLGRRFRRMHDLEISVNTHDEIEQLADEFGVMVRKLENSYQRLEMIITDKSRIAQEKSKLAENLKELNLQKEALIKERTREVVEKNLRLFEISEELQFQKEDLINMNEQLEKTSRMKSEFLAGMSHELRTPVNSIIGFAEVLKDKMFGELNERQEKYLSNILASGRHLLQLINNILDISKVEAGKMKLAIESFAINRVIDEVQNIIRTLAYKKNIELNLQLTNDLIFEGDAAKFKQILYNLLSNAIKFTDEKGMVTITTKMVSAGTVFAGGPCADGFTTTEDSFLLAIRDTGIGIKPEDQERVFIEFEQTARTRRRYEGTGLGLTLTRKLVHLHGGKIWVKSEVGKGSEFFIVMPIKAKAEPETGEEEV